MKACLLSFLWRHVLDAVVAVNDAQDIEQLTLVFMDTLDLHIHHCVRSDCHAGELLNALHSALFGRALDLLPFLLEAGIFCMLTETLQFLSAV